MDNKIPVMMTLTSGGEPDGEIRMQVRGTAMLQPRGLLLAYTEVMEDPDGGPSVTSDIRLLVREGHVTMMRSGEYGSTMVFERGKRFETDYHTPYGDMSMAVVATRVDCVPEVRAGKLSLDYQLTISGFTSGRTMRIQWHSGEETC